MLFKLLEFCDWGLKAVAKRALVRHHPRLYSNQVLRKYLAHLSGDIINVSGWEDGDRAGGRYRDYYGSCNRYVISNIDGVNGMPASLPPDVESVFLDLEEPLDPALTGKFDIAFAHSVFEHIYETRIALENMAALSSDLVVIVSPFSQAVHYTHSYSDYVRLTPFYFKRFFEERGFTVMLCTCNDQSFMSVYLEFIASRHPERHKEIFAGAPVSYDIQVHPYRWGSYGHSSLNQTGE